VLITINTTEITDADRAILALVLEGYDGSAAQAPTTPMAARAAERAEKPKRSRRTNLEIAFDTAKEAHDADPTELAALVTAAEDLKAKDPGNERLTDFDPADYQPTPDSENAESDAVTLDSENAESDAVTLEDLKTLAGELIAEHGRAALQGVVTELGIKRLSDAPADRYAEAAELIRTKLNG
jgi:hypothetical protein